MKKVLAIALLAPSLVFGKSVSFTPIGEDIDAASTGSPSNVIITLTNISSDGKKAALKYTETGNRNKKTYKAYEWRYQTGLEEKDYDALSNVIIGDDFTVYKSINTNDTVESGFTYESNSELITVTPQDIPNDFLPNGPEISIKKITVTSQFGSNGVIGMITGDRNASGNAGFIWTKENGFQNPTYNIPTCYWYNCSLHISSGDVLGKGIVGVNYYKPLYLDTTTETVKNIDLHGYSKGIVTKLSSNGEHAIIYYINNPLGSIANYSIYDIQNEETTFIPPYVIYDWVFGHTSKNVILKGITDTGSMAIGYSGQDAVIWTASLGTKNLAEYVTSEYGVDLQGWTLTSANYISPNGQYIYGEGTTPAGLRRVWGLELNRICETPDW